MNRIIVTSLLIMFCVSFHLNSKQRIDFNGQYKITCTGAQGLVSFGAEDLPSGMKLKGDTIVVENADLLKDGYYPVKLTASDEHNEDSKIVLMIVKKSSIQSLEQNQVKAEPINIPVIAPQTERVNSVLDQLQVPLSIESKYQYPEGGYPTGNMPTGINENIFNFVPSRISAHQATPSSANRNQITADDVRSNSIFQRQLNAAKALANLLSIVKQATANKNVALEEIQKRSKIHEEVLAVQRVSQEKVLDAQNNLARIKKGIETTNERIDMIRGKINDQVNEQEKKKIETESLVTGASNAQQTLEEVTDQIRLEQEKLFKVQQDLEDKRIQCEGLQFEIELAEDQLTEKQLERASLSVDLQQAQQKVSQNQQKVNQIKQLLADAEALLQESESALEVLENRSSSIGKEIQSAQKKIDDLKLRALSCQEEIASIQERVQELKIEIIPSLEEKRVQIQIQISRLEGETQQIHDFLDSLPSQIEDLEIQLEKMMESLRYLKSQIFIYEKELRSAYAEGNVANQKLEEAKMNLEAANKRYIDETEIIDEAKLNIEQARIEKVKADQAVESYLRQGVDILPFAAAPGQSGFQPIGSGEYSIKSWDEFVRIAYGNVQPLFIGTLDKLYQFKLSNLNEGQCKSPELKAVSGYILQVLEDRFVIITNEGEQFAISYSSCTKLMSNIQEYEFSPGDIVALKGIMLSDTEIEATQLSTIRR